MTVIKDAFDAGYSRGKDFELKRIKIILIKAYDKCLKCYNTVKKESMKQDFHQRLDEIALIYSEVSEVSVNMAHLTIKEFIEKDEDSQKAEVKK